MSLLVQMCEAYILFYVLHKLYKVTKTSFVVEEISGQPQRD